MKAIVLVGGEGTRLRPLTYDTPKQLLPVAGKPMIERVLEHLAMHGVHEAVLSLGYLPDAFSKAYPDGIAAGVRLTYAVEPEPYDTAGAARFAAEAAGVDETFVVLNGDVLTDMDVTRLVRLHREQHAEATIALHPVDDPSRFGVVTTDADGRVRAFVEKPPRELAPTNRINAGIYIMEPAILERIPERTRVSIERETFPAMVAEGRLFAFSDHSYWLDTGTPAAYLQANHDLLTGVRGVPPLPKATEVADSVWVDGEAVIEGHVEGPSLLGDQARVARGAVIGQSVLGRCCIVEEGARVTRSVLMDGVAVGSRALVADSILGSGSRVGERGEVRGLSVLGQGAAVPPGTVLDADRVPAP